MKLVEIFNQPMNITVIKQTEDVFLTEFKTSTGQLYEVCCEMELGVEPPTWYISFSSIQYIHSDRLYHTHITNQGNAFEVFTGVKQSIDMFLQKYEANVLMFTAENSEPSRISLYKRLIKLLASGWHTEAVPHKSQHFDYTAFKLVKNSNASQ